MTNEQMTVTDMAVDTLAMFLLQSVLRTMVAYVKSFPEIDSRATPVLAYGHACNVWNWRLDDIQRELNGVVSPFDPDALTMLRSIEVAYRSGVEAGVMRAMSDAVDGKIPLDGTDEEIGQAVMSSARNISAWIRPKLDEIFNGSSDTSP